MKRDEEKEQDGNDDEVGEGGEGSHRKADET